MRGLVISLVTMYENASILDRIVRRLPDRHALAEVVLRVPGSRTARLFLGPCLPTGINQSCVTLTDRVGSLKVYRVQGLEREIGSRSYPFSIAISESLTEFYRTQRPDEE